MEVRQGTEYEDECQKLRLELKQWEGKWAKVHKGNKPTRHDIKQNPDIAQKYKAYSKVRETLAGKTSALKPAPLPSKRKADDAPQQSPVKRARPAQTPQANARYADAAATPSTARKLFSPAIPTSIGPTPQRDGRVLGLFDLLEEAEMNTPSRSLGETHANGKVQATPSKQTAFLAQPESTVKLGRTPVSASKRMLLDSFMTPLRKRDGYIQGGKTPTSVSKLQFATPAFLRRAPLPAVDENGEFKSPEPLKLPRKPLIRGLSSVITNLRKLEEQEMDEDLELLNEMENGGDQPAPKPAPRPTLTDNVLVADSQVQSLPLGGFDDEGMYDSAPEEQLDRGQPLRDYKKKGQKRTTRRVNMRPTRKKRPAPAEEGHSEGEDTDEAVPETQISLDSAGQEAVYDMASRSEFGEPDDGEAAKKKSKRKGEKKSKEPAKEGKEAKEGKVKKAVKKVNELAHANFKRLKLRNNGAKGGPGHNSRFRRRR